MVDTAMKYVERPGVLAETEVRPILDPHLPGLLDDFQVAWDWVQDILDQDLDRRATFDSSTQAAMIFNRFASLMGHRMDGQNRICLKRSGRMLRAVIDDRVAIRFKKLRKNRKGALCASNVHTNAQSRMYYQLCIDGLEDCRPTEVTFGYTTDDTNTIVTGLYLTCPISWHTNKWTVQLDGMADEGTLPFVAPENPDQPADGVAEVVITPRIKKEAAG